MASANPLLKDQISDIVVLTKTPVCIVVKKNFVQNVRGSVAVEMPGMERVKQDSPVDWL